MASLLLTTGVAAAAVPVGTSAAMRVSVHVPDCSVARVAGSEAAAGCGALVRGRPQPGAKAEPDASCAIGRASSDDACEPRSDTAAGPVEVFF